MEVGSQRHFLTALPPGKDPVAVVQEIWRAPGPVWTGAENCPTPNRDLIPGPVQPVTSRYTYWAIPAHVLKGALKKIDWVFWDVACSCERINNASGVP
jgi:hypothetical protein